MTWSTVYTLSPGTAVSATDFNTGTAGNLTHLYDNMPIRARLFHDEALVTAGNALAITYDSAQRYGFYAEQSASADGDTFTYSFVLAAGTYTMTILGRQKNSAGKIDWDLDGTTITSGQDWYGTGTANTLKTVGSIVVSEGKRLVLTGTINGKNASSSSYDMALTKIWFNQAADT